MTTFGKEIPYDSSGIPPVFGVRKSIGKFLTVPYIGSGGKEPGNTSRGGMIPTKMEEPQVRGGKVRFLSM
jgi:hypothetical protein